MANLTDYNARLDSAKGMVSKPVIDQDRNLKLINKI